MKYNTAVIRQSTDNRRIDIMFVYGEMEKLTTVNKDPKALMKVLRTYLHTVNPNTVQSNCKYGDQFVQYYVRGQ